MSPSIGAMFRTTLASSGRFFAFALILLLLPALTACGENLDPRNPEGAYNVFRASLIEGDAEGVWNRLAPSSHEYFQEQYERLVQMDATIEKYLPPTDHKLAREQAGSILTDEVKDGKGLFMKIFQGKQLPPDESYKVGMDVEEVTVTEDEMSAKLVTRGKQTYILTRVEGSEEWFVMFVRSNDVMKKRMGWLDANESALSKTVEDLIDEEKGKREKLIAQLMGLESGGSEEQAAAPSEE